MAASFIRTEILPPQPPASRQGRWLYLAGRMFGTPRDAALSILGICLLVFFAYPVIRFTLIDAVWVGTSRDDCKDVLTGACWPYVHAKLGQFIYGFYPAEERWRPNLVFLAGALLLAPLLVPSAPWKRLNAIVFFLIYPVFGFVLLTGGGLDFQRFVVGKFIPLSDYVGARQWMGMRAVFWADYAASAAVLTTAVTLIARLLGTPVFTSLKVLVSFFVLLAVLIAPVDYNFGLQWVETREWGGLLVTLVVAVTGIVAALPIGVLLALGRRSEMFLIRWLSIIFIEFWRGVPLITVLFFATYMLPLFLPGGASIERLVRALIGVALFSGAYMAEVIRGGLAAVPRQQYEGAAALGFGYWKTMGLVVLPQALTHVIPGIVNNFIGLFKDTTLVLIVAILDLLGQIRASLADPNWAGPTTLYTGFAFAGAIYFAFCFGMSRYSQFLERRSGGSALRLEMERR